ncbi:uncharacterized protein F5891DRAFT_940152 [Suillus fuscotomentosus]|uniref:Nuclear GTPase SLIP-GC n=1 Tax=Suillus fuscotomentosus TaxID=1912939 RepID=A0AAD4ELM5_9AGAM|nr:uncharacterized protein F5891DRAFT_940152 [Suillus fuscotomentosus]KAG1907278.1 hypothetical protein F5891DRAFT_940152 [Suillus fuscotomentosus]
MGSASVSLGFFYPLVLPFSPSSSRFQSARGIFIKPEPEELHAVPSFESTRHNSKTSTLAPTVKAEPIEGTTAPSNITLDGQHNLSSAPDVKKFKREPVLPHEQRVHEPMLYELHDSADNISYTPEAALQAGLGMVKTLKAGINKLELGSKLRKDVWLREIDNLLSQGAPTTMIAVCGATGAGKSSILNAILDDNIVPTSGMRACTAVVTEIAYHAAPTINADVSFLSEAEWRAELAVLLDDLVDEDGNLKRTTDLRSDSGVAWHKVHAVYPHIAQEQLIHLTVDQILARDKNITNVLGTTKKISAKNSTIFAQEIAKYIDSKDQKRGGKKDKTKDKNKETKKKDHGPALWPLIRQVNVRCNAQALSTGAILVDLPGVADANAARNSIAKDYMKKCNCIWILAPITRAVDDKTARDLLGEAFKLQLMSTYDAHTITFIASKCDDISCSEVIPALGIEDDPELEEIEGRIEQYKEETADFKKKKTTAESSMKAIDKQLKDVRAFLAEYEQHKTALENGETFTPRLTTTAHKKAQSAGKKRKNTRRGKSGSPKRHKHFGEDDDDDDFEMDDIDDYLNDDIHVDDDDEGSYDEDDDDDDDDDEEEEGDSDGEEDTPDESEENVTVEVLQEKIGDAKEAIKVEREQLNNARKARKDAVDALSNLKKKTTKAQRDKNAFCSLKRSEFSRDVLKEDFRVGLKDLDDAAAEERNPDSFDPTHNLRNYDDIDLPVFTCSSRDYVRITGQVKGDGDPSCFSNLEDTGIPSLRQWCHKLTISSRSRAAKQFHTHLKTFANSVRVYVDDIGDVTIADRESLREKWESTPQGGEGMYDDEDEDEDEDMPHWHGSPDPMSVHLFQPYRGTMSRALMDARLFSMNNQSSLKVDARGEPIGVTPRLVKEFGIHVEKSVSDLQDLFRDGLEDKCRVGAANAAEDAVQHVDEFAASMHWATYRATLRRHGSWRRDLNVELVTPFTRNIASSWSTLFESDLFASLSDAIMTCINKLIADVEASAAAGLKDHVHAQSSVSQEEARHALVQTMEVVKEALGKEQKEISRCLAPHVQNELTDGYNLALQERGSGSVARQKAIFHNYVDGHKHDAFDGGAEVLMGRLSTAAETIGKALKESLRELAEKIEVSLAVLWEGTQDVPNQIHARLQIMQSVSKLLDQLDMWSKAAEKASAAS